MASLTTAGAIAGSAAAPLVLRTFDNPGGSFTRKSVVVPTLLGGGLVGASIAVDRGTISSPLGSRRGFSSLAMLSGAAMLGGAAANAAVPSKGDNFSLPA